MMGAGVDLWRDTSQNTLSIEYRSADLSQCLVARQVIVFVASSPIIAADQCKNYTRR